jgi:hypothetical protein
MTTKVTLVIKNPSQPQDFRLELPLAATVLALKSAIEEDYISKPRVDLQRLIFSGRLLRDEEVLSDVFRLVCPNNTRVWNCLLAKLRLIFSLATNGGSLLGLHVTLCLFRYLPLFGTH